MVALNSRLDQQSTEKELDGETGLTYFGARYLDAELGSWTALDPMGQYHHGYSFVGGNPINFIDRWGLEGDKVFTPSGDEYVETYPDQAEGVARAAQQSRGPADASNVYVMPPPRFSDPPVIRQAYDRGNYIPDEFERLREVPAFEASKKAAENAPDAIVTAATLTPWGLPEAMLLRMGKLGRWLLGSKAASRIVPGGGLMGHELMGGHLIARHVGKTEAELAARLAAEPKILAASTFLSRSEAEAVVSAVLDVRATQIANWVLSGAKGQLTLSASLRSGAVLQRGASAAATGSGVKVILRGTGNGGWRIHTGFPTP